MLFFILKISKGSFEFVTGYDVKNGLKNFLIFPHFSISDVLNCHNSRLETYLHSVTLENSNVMFPLETS